MRMTGGWNEEDIYSECFELVIKSQSKQEHKINETKSYKSAVYFFERLNYY